MVLVKIALIIPESREMKVNNVLQIIATLLKKLISMELVQIARYSHMPKVLTKRNVKQMQHVLQQKKHSAKRT